MSAVECKRNCICVDHQEYLKNLYQNTVDCSHPETETISCFIPKPCHFVITTPHLLTKNKIVATDTELKKCKTRPSLSESSLDVTCSNDVRKRKRKLPFNDGELQLMQYHESVKNLLIESALSMTNFFKVNFSNTNAVKQEITTSIVHSNHDNCSFIQNWKDSLKYIKLANSSLASLYDYQLFYSFENNCDFSHLMVANDTRYLIPMHCKCICSDISNLKPLLRDCKQNGSYSCILLDPPWENKSVKRSKKYNALSFDQINKIPFDKLCKKNCLIVIWVTNKQKINHWVKESLFPKWNITFLTEWHWVKLTALGEPVFPWDSLHKKPYETLILGCYQYSDIFSTDHIPHLVIGSMPSTIHSHKPPLSEIIKKYCLQSCQSKRYLEMFARNLTSGWTSWGNEVLTLQNVNYFDRQ